MEKDDLFVSEEENSQKLMLNFVKNKKVAKLFPLSITAMATAVVGCLAVYHLALANPLGLILLVVTLGSAALMAKEAYEIKTLNSISRKIKKQKYNEIVDKYYNNKLESLSDSARFVQRAIPNKNKTENVERCQ